MSYNFLILPAAFAFFFTCYYVVDSLSKIRKHFGIDKEKKQDNNDRDGK